MGIVCRVYGESVDVELRGTHCRKILIYRRPVLGIRDILVLRQSLLLSLSGKIFR
jgi:hypothetical protein